LNGRRSKLIASAVQYALSAFSSFFSFLFSFASCPDGFLPTDVLFTLPALYYIDRWGRRPMVRRCHCFPFFLTVFPHHLTTFSPPAPLRRHRHGGCTSLFHPLIFPAVAHSLSHNSGSASSVRFKPPLDTTLRAPRPALQPPGSFPVTLRLVTPSSVRLPLPPSLKVSELTFSFPLGFLLLLRLLLRHHLGTGVLDVRILPLLHLLYIKLIIPPCSYASEIFPARVRGKAVSYVTASKLGVHFVFAYSVHI
jgi:hypothetical protein